MYIRVIVHPTSIQLIFNHIFTRCGLGRQEDPTLAIYDLYILLLARTIMTFRVGFSRTYLGRQHTYNISPTAANTHQISGLLKEKHSNTIRRDAGKPALPKPF